MRGILPPSTQVTRRAPLVLLFSHEAFTRNRLSGYGQAIHALGAGLTAKGIDCHVLTPHIRDYYAYQRPETPGYVFTLEIKGRKPFLCSFFHQVRDGVSYLEIDHADKDGYFGFSTYKEGDKNNIMSSTDLPEQYAGGTLTDAALVYNYALAKAAALIGGENTPFKQVIAHGHDHLTALAIYLAHRAGIPTAFTVHNPAYTSLLPAETARALDINPGDRPQLDLLGLALAYADILTTVSPRYAQEMESRYFDYGPTDLKYGSIICGRNRRSRLVGILNALVPSYLKDIARKTREQGSPVSVLAANRLDHAKGYDRLLESFPLAVELAAAAGVKLNFEIIASGDPLIKKAIEETRKKAPEGSLCLSGYHEEGFRCALRSADLAIQPSRFEPCGLFAMTAQAQGVLPIVAQTGGLMDIVGKSIASSKDYALIMNEYGFSFGALPWAFWKAVIKTAKLVQDNDPRIAGTRERMMLRAQQEYAPTRMAQDYLDQVYSQLIK